MGEDIMKCIRLCQELETSKDGANIIPILNACEKIEEVIWFIELNGILYKKVVC